MPGTNPVAALLAGQHRVANDGDGRGTWGLGRAASSVGRRATLIEHLYKPPMIAAIPATAAAIADTSHTSASESPAPRV